MKKEIRLKVYDKFKGRCAYCGDKIKYEEMQVDHIKPLCRGISIQPLSKIGKDEIENYNPSCRSCNFRKGMLSIDEFRNAIQNGLNVLNRNFTFRLLIKYGLIKVKDKEIKFLFEKRCQNGKTKH